MSAASIYNHLRTLMAFADSAVPQVQAMSTAILKAFREDPRNSTLPTAVSLFDSMIQSNLDHMANGIAVAAEMCREEHRDACAQATRGWLMIREAWLSQVRGMEDLLVKVGNVPAVDIGKPAAD
jgi:hypothetical protein